MENNKTKEWFLSDFKRLENNLNGESKLSIHRLRKEAADKISGLQVPTTKNEEWKYTNIAPILDMNFGFAERNDEGIEISKDIRDAVKNMDASLVVFVNGFYSERLSALKQQEGMKIEKLSLALESKEFSERYFSVREKDRFFTSLNEAFVQDGIYVHTYKGRKIEKPVYLLYLAGDDNRYIANHPRNIIITEENSELTVIEHYKTMEDKQRAPLSELPGTCKPYFTNSVSQYFAGENSFIDVYKIQDEALNAYHISLTETELSPNSNFRSTLISYGGKLVRNDLNSVLNGEGCECSYYGLYLSDDEQLIDNHTLMDHAKPHCLSNELYKGILGGKSRGVFNGKVIVRKDAQKTNAYQSNKNIIISNEALMNTKPQLEIFADDVKCSHGATVGQLDDESVFYLQSRGIDEKTSKAMLISAFANEISEMIKPEGLKAEIEKHLYEKLNMMEHN